MERLCERPSCSDPASVSYGMVAEDLIFWLEAGLAAADTVGVGVLCLRHADAMVVPNGWTLDDHRDPDLRLFRAPADVSEPRTRAVRRRHGGPDTEQLSFDHADGRAPSSSTGDVPVDAREGDRPDPSPSDHGGDFEGSDAGASDRGDAEGNDSWTPAFDTDDDLDGLLSARSPLLARAFRGDDRPQGV